MPNLDLDLSGSPQHSCSITEVTVECPCSDRKNWLLWEPDCYELGLCYKRRLRYMMAMVLWGGISRSHCVDIRHLDSGHSHTIHNQIARRET